MTTYPSEKHYLQDQVKSNNLAIKFLKKELNKTHDELKPDFLGTNEKIAEVKSLLANKPPEFARISG